MNKYLKLAHLQMDQGNSQLATDFYQKACQTKRMSKADKAVANYMLAYLQLFPRYSELSVLGPDLRNPITASYERAGEYFAEIDYAQFNPAESGLPCFVSYELTCIALSNHLAALNIVKNKVLAQQLTGWQLYEIGMEHLLAALVILNDQPLLMKLSDQELDKLRNNHFRYLQLREERQQGPGMASIFNGNNYHSNAIFAVC